MMQNDAITALTREGIFQYLPQGFDREKLQVFDVIDSTNTEAKRQASQGAPHGTILVANSQTAGRGRVGRSFYSPRDGGVYFSILLRPTVSGEETVLITTAASVAVADAIEAVCGVYPKIKWVNDLYIEEKKVCGILAESVINPECGKVDGVVVGVGINCDCEFPEELQPIAGNIPLATDVKNRLAAELSVRLLGIEAMVLDRKYLRKYREHSLVLGRWITIPQELGSSWYVQEIGEKGELILEDNSGNHRVLSTGEISVRLSGRD